MKGNGINDKKRNRENYGKIKNTRKNKKILETKKYKCYIYIYIYCIKLVTFFQFVFTLQNYS